MQIICDHRSVSFGQLLERSLSTAAWLQEHCGARPDGTIVLGLENGIEHVEMVLATWRVGSKVVIVPPTISSQTLRSILGSHTEVVMVIDHRNQRLLDAVDDRFRRATYGEDPETALLVLSTASAGATAPVAHASGEWTEWLPQLPDSTFFTSGSTAEAKGVLLTWKGILDKGARVLDHYGATHADRVMPILPLSHVYGLYLLLGTILKGADAVLLPESASPAKIAESLATHAVSVVVCPPIIGSFIYGRDEVDDELQHNLRVVSMGGAATRPEMAAAIVRHLPKARVFLSYGLAETYSTISCNEISIPGSDPLAVGPLLFGAFGEVRDPATDERVPPGGVGELLVGGTITRSYVSTSGTVTDCLTPDGLFRTGDLVQIDDHGHVTLRGRIKEIINAGGTSIAPSEVEEVIKLHPSVRDCGVFGEESGDLEILCAAVVFVDASIQAAEANLESLFAHCEANLARKMVPRRIIPLSEIPRGSLGKVKRAELRALCAKQAP